ncbi:hypothetical protein RYX36_008554 [Vicia faba]
MEKLKFSRQVEWWQKNIIYPVRSLWISIATRFGIRKTGLKKLKNDVRACEYEDIHVMWEMLNGNESLSEFGGNSPNKIKKMHHLKLFKWARCVAPYTSHS